jgi:hypothetical protein
LNDPGSQRDSDIEVIIHLADGDLSRLPALATDLINVRVEAILAAGPPAVQAASGATKSVPVIALDGASSLATLALCFGMRRCGNHDRFGNAGVSTFCEPST